MSRWAHLGGNGLFRRFYPAGFIWMEQILEAGIKGKAEVISAFGNDELLSPMSQVEIWETRWWGRGGVVESFVWAFPGNSGAWNSPKKCKTVEIKVLTSAIWLISFPSVFLKMPFKVELGPVWVRAS